MRVVFVSDHFCTPEEPGVLRTWHFAHYLCQAGDDVVVIAPRSYHSFSRHGAAADRPSLAPGLKLVGLPARTNGTGTVSRMLRYLQHLVGSSIETWKAGPCDVVVVGLTPSVLALGPYLVAKMRRTPFVVDERDLALDAAASLGLLPAWILVVARMFESFVHRHADHVIVVSNGIRRLLLERGIAGDRLTVVLNGYDPVVGSHSSSRDELRRQLGWDGRTVILYAGGIGPSHDLALALDAVSQLSQDDILLCIVGDGEDKVRLRQTADRRSLPVQFLAPRPKRDIPGLCRAADICLLPLNSHPRWSCALPAKLFDYLGAGSPVVVAAPPGDASALVQESKAGVVVRPGDAGQLAAALAMLASDASARASMGAAGRAFVSEYFRRDRFSAQFRGALLATLAARDEHAVRRSKELGRIERVYRHYDSDPASQAIRDQNCPGLRALVEHRSTVTEKVIGDLALPDEPRVLDVGCGSGDGLALAAGVLAVKRPGLYGVDILPDRIAAARARLPEAHLDVRSADQLPFEDGFFDLIIALTFFSSLLDERFAAAVAAELLRVLGPRGKLLSYDVRYPNPTNRNTRPVTRRRLRRLFPGTELFVRPVTLLPPLARRLGPLAPVMYRPLHAVPALRSHYLAVVSRHPDHPGGLRDWSAAA